MACIDLLNQALGVMGLNEKKGESPMRSIPNFRIVIQQELQLKSEKGLKPQGDVKYFSGRRFTPIYLVLYTKVLWAGTIGYGVCLGTILKVHPSSYNHILELEESTATIRSKSK